MSALRGLLPALLVAGLALPALAPHAAARHVCHPLEPPWSCGHWDPSPAEVIEYVCDLLGDPFRFCAPDGLP